MASPFFDPRQVAGQGILGQGLQGQAQQLGPGLLGGAQPAPAPQAAAMTAPPVPTQPPPKVRQGFTLLDPKDWTPEEHALYRQAHDIQQTHGPSIWDQLKEALSGMSGSQAR